MEAYCVYLIIIMKELLHITLLVKGVADSVVLDAEETSNMHIYVHEDNMVCLVFVKYVTQTNNPMIWTWLHQVPLAQENNEAKSKSVLKVIQWKHLGDIRTKGLL